MLLVGLLFWIVVPECIVKVFLLEICGCLFGYLLVA
jgi:hypothetical protein